MAIELTQRPPTDAAALAALERPLRDLHRELRTMLAALPVEAQTASGLARYLRIERTTCQRAVSAVTQPFAGVELATQLPGPRGLRLLADAVRRRIGPGNTGDRVAALRAAIDSYELETRHVAGTRSRLLRIIESATPVGSAPPADVDLRARQQLFHAAAALTGRSSQTWLAAHIYEPHGANRGLMQTRAHGLIGHEARDDAVPLTLHIIPPEPRPAADRGAPAEPVLAPLVAALDDGAPAEVLREFSTRPIPIVHSQQPNEFIVQTVEPNPVGDGKSRFDVLFALRGAMLHPAETPSRLEEVWALINFPVRRLLLDVYLHRDLARDCIPGLDVHLWRPDFAAHVGERWQTRFAHGPTLQVLGSGLRSVATDAYARHRALIEFLFSARGLNPADYVGYRCDVLYPIWRTGYRVTLDFGGRDE